MSSDPYDQRAYPARLRWGRRGALDAAARGELLVVVDVLSFSTGVCWALAAGVEVFPCAPEEGPALADALGARLAVRRGAPGPSLSPASLRGLPAGTRLVLPSPNGSACSRIGAACPALVLGALVNARAAAAAAEALHLESGRPVCVLACGERWREPPAGPAEQQGWAAGEELRVALEDALGAGAILSALSLERSPEAEHAALAFEAARPRLSELLAASGSGRELIAAGFAADVEAAAELDRAGCVPRLAAGRFVHWRQA